MELARRTIVAARAEIESYIAEQPRFLTRAGTAARRHGGAAAGAAHGRGRRPGRGRPDGGRGRGHRPGHGGGAGRGRRPPRHRGQRRRPGPAHRPPGDHRHLHRDRPRSATSPCAASRAPASFPSAPPRGPWAIPSPSAAPTRPRSSPPTAAWPTPWPPPSATASRKRARSPSTRPSATRWPTGSRGCWSWPESTWAWAARCRRSFALPSTRSLISQGQEESMKKIKAAVLGCTGLVGHAVRPPAGRSSLFRRCRCLTASSRSAGKAFAEPLVDRPRTAWRARTRAQVIRETTVAAVVQSGARVVFSALPAGIAAELEAELRRRGLFVFSNASAHRMDADVPLLIPEANAEHLALARRAAARNSPASSSPIPTAWWRGWRWR